VDTDGETASAALAVSVGRAWWALSAAAERDGASCLHAVFAGADYRL
jgi:hypothetical protein